MDKQASEDYQSLNGVDRKAKDLEKVKRKLRQELELENQGQINTQSLVEVEVKVLNLNWMFANNSSFSDFCRSLGNLNNEKIYSTEFVNNLIETFWSLY